MCIHSIFGGISGLTSIVPTDSVKNQSLKQEMQTMRCSIGILEGMNAKQHIIIR